MALSRPKRGFESRWGRQPSLALRASFGWASQRVALRRRLSRRSAQAKAQREGGLSTEHLNTCVTLQELPRLHFFSEHTHGILRIRSGAAIARRTCVSYSKRFVYILRSTADPRRCYVGLTSDVARRLGTHNSGGSLHTVDHRPWELVAAVEFSNENSAILFERYLKTGSGRAFAKRHFV